VTFLDLSVEQRICLLLLKFHESDRCPPLAVLDRVDFYSTHSAAMLQALSAASRAPHDNALLHWQGLVAYASVPFL
jgi:hypothetical protein